MKVNLYGRLSRHVHLPQVIFLYIENYVPITKYEKKQKTF